MSFGASFCSIPTVHRAEIDAAVYRYFEQVGLDVEATRRQIAEARERKLAEVRALRQRAETEARRADERLARVRRAFQDGSIEADDWAEQREQLTEERKGAYAEADRLLDQEGEVEGWGELRDVEAETLRQLARIRAAIAGEIRDTDGIEPVRAALNRTFERFVLHRSAPGRAHIELIGETWIEPVVREQAIEGYTENLHPILRPEPLGQAENKNHQGVGYRLVDG
jgi:hypothetical protein